jgi:hypothetical protein
MITDITQAARIMVMARSAESISFQRTKNTIMMNANKGSSGIRNVNSVIS